jgi:hypothetical protein
MTLMVVQQECVRLYQDFKIISRKYKKTHQIHQNYTIINLSPMSQISKKRSNSQSENNQQHHNLIKLSVKKPSDFCYLARTSTALQLLSQYILLPSEAPCRECRKEKNSPQGVISTFILKNRVCFLR